ncbi:MAG: hypothetical protein QXU67_03765, partial [Candidatus Bathyarchaeia archaeon]
MKVTFWNLKEGNYEVRVVLSDRFGVLSREVLALNYQESISVPYEFRLGKGGGFKIVIKGENFPVESSYSFPSFPSFPFGGENKLLASDDPDRNGEPFWQVETEKINSSNYKVVAKGRFYSIERLIQLFSNHIKILDKLTNLSPDALGIVISNHIDLQLKKVNAVYFRGWQKLSPSSYELVPGLKTNPTVFISGEGYGIGLIALDDVYVIQSRGHIGSVNIGGGCFGDGAGIYTLEFALDKNSSYTLEWAVYPVNSEDYYDFINQVRKDEGRNGKVDGGFAFITKSPWDRRMIPTKEFVELRGIKYGAIHCLSGAADDPKISIEGIEFME